MSSRDEVHREPVGDIHTEPNALFTDMTAIRDDEYAILLSTRTVAEMSEATRAALFTERKAQAYDVDDL